MRRSVVLPAPDAPSIDTNWPRLTLSDTSFSTARPANTRLTPSSSSAVSRSSRTDLAYALSGEFKARPPRKSEMFERTHDEIGHDAERRIHENARDDDVRALVLV